jgi:four helix bundle protein
MAPIRSYRDLLVWQKSIAMIKEAYCATSAFPDDERYGLANQLKRAAVSVAANIAEGHARATTGDYIRFLNISYGSLAEIETHIVIARELGMISFAVEQNLLEQSAEIGRMLNGLIASLKKKKLPESRILNPESSLEAAS